MVQWVEELIDRLFKREGRYVNDPSDSGGETDWGISKRAHPRAWADGKVTEDEAKDIYYTEYFSQPRLALLPNKPLIEQVFDFGVTSGPTTAIAILQRVLKVSVDGKIGPQTIKAVMNYPGQRIYGAWLPGDAALNFAYEVARMQFYIRLAQKRPKDVKFLAGWFNRVIGHRSI